MYFHTDDLATLQWLASVLTLAHEQNSSIRIKVNDDNSLQVKRGGTWTAPIYSTHDFSRDESPHCGHDQCAQNKKCTYI